MNIKLCCVCKQTLSIDNFYKDRQNKDGYQSRCKNCNKSYYNRNPEQYKKAGRDRELKRKFGIDLKIYREMHEEQEGKCWICSSEEKVAGTLSVDHDHSTGSVRKLLCTHCNTGLGLFKDNPGLLRAAAKYVEEHSADR